MAVKHTLAGQQSSILQSTVTTCLYAAHMSKGLTQGCYFKAGLDLLQVLEGFEFCQKLQSVEVGTGSRPRQPVTITDSGKL